jgi:transposase/CheY-like chemotaxis protein
MKRFIEGECREQSTLLPERLDDWIAEDNPVRAVDAFVDELDLAKLGFEGAEPAATGRPAYHPATLLKIYVYGYLNRLPSSRRLERETQRNLELIWLTGRLTPDFKTIADFRRDNGPAIRLACRQFVLLCRELGLFEQALVAIDGSKFKAVNNRDKNFTPHKLKARNQQLDQSIARYLSELDRADRDPSLVPEARVEHLKQKIATVREQMKKLEAIGRQLAVAPDQQVSLTDPDARSMATSGRGTGMVGYNVQAAVDTEHHLIVAHDVTNEGHDRAQLTVMAQQTKETLQTDDLKVLADRGYFSSDEILKCEQAGVTPLVLKPITHNAATSGRFDKRDFMYEAEHDRYRCPAGQYATWRFTTIEAGLTLHKYWSSACPKCPIRSACTPSPYRRIARWEHEDVLERMQQRLDATPGAGRMRRQTVEHTFGTLKSWMGASHFLTKRLPSVRTEMSLQVLAYNLKRVMQIMGVQPLIAAMRA